jgi:PKD repeat protein
LYDANLTVTNADGTDSLTRADAIEVVEPGTRETLLFDGFETGFDAWWSDGNGSWSTEDPQHGDHAMRFTGNNLWADRYVSTLGYEQIRLSA